MSAIPDSDTGRTRLLEEILRILQPMRQEISDLRTESAKESARNRAENHAQIESVKVEMRSGFDAQRSDTAELFRLTGILQKKDAETTAQLQAITASAPATPKPKAVNWDAIGKAVGVALGGAILVVLGALGLTR